jgi:voltage-gated potassium channel
MMVLILISVITLIREVKHDVNEELLFFNYYIISLIFFVEYILRLWITSSVSQKIIERYENDSMLGRNFCLSCALFAVFKAKLAYITSIKAIIDLVAILPFFHQLRLLRIFVLFRVFKLFRYAKSFQTFSSVFSSKRFEFITLIVFATVVILISSILIYVMEANNPASPVNTLFDAIYWSIVTIATVGYGDVTPITDAGRVVAMFVIIAGIAVLAFSTSLVVSAFSEKIDEVRETKIVNTLSSVKQFYIICGYENIAKEVAKKLSKSKFNLIILDENEHRIAEARKDGFWALNFDPGSVESYKRLEIDFEKQVKAILCLREDDVENVYTTLTVRSFSKDVKILSLLMQQSNRKKLHFAGADEILYSKELVGMIARVYVGQPVAFEIIHALRSEFTSVNIEEIYVSERISVNYAFVKDLENVKYRIVLLGIYKQKTKHFYFNPIDDTLLEEGDYLLVIGNSLFIKEYEKYLKKR